MKKQWMKRMLGLALSAAMLVGSVNPVAAAEAKEIQQLASEITASEISQTELDAQAIALTLNQQKSDALTTLMEEKWYKFEITQRGYFKADFTIADSTDSDDIHNGWNVEIYKKGDLRNSIKKRTSITGNEIFPSMPMESGTYYIKVYAADTYSDSRAPLNCTYNIRVNFTPSNYWEVEGNDSSANPNVVLANTSYSGTLYKLYDEDWYKVTTSENGYFQLKFTLGPDIDVDSVNNGWYIEIYNSDYEKIKGYYNITSSLAAPVLPFAKGTYFVKVAAQDTYSDGRAPIDCIYNLNLISKDDATWETEKNDFNTTADVISVNKEYKGLLYHLKDADWYKVTTTKNGYFQIQFTVDGTVKLDDINNGWNISVYDKYLNEIITYYNIKSSQTQQLLPYVKGTYYVKVYAADTYSDGRAPIDCTYRLKVIQKSSSAWETENNNTSQTSDKISLNKTYSGILTQYTDVDWYKISVPAAGKVKVNLTKNSTVNLEDINSGWSVYVYNTSSTNPIYEKKGIKNTDSIEASLKKGTYYIKVCAADSYSEERTPRQCIYDLKVNYSQTPAKVTLKSAKAGKKQVTLTWAKAKNATGYYIYRSTSRNGKYTKIATIKKAATVKYTDKKSLKSKKTYYYKVVAYHTANGVTATASASAVKYAKTK